MKTEQFEIFTKLSEGMVCFTWIQMNREGCGCFTGEKSRRAKRGP